MQIIYAREPLPTVVTKSIMLCGPTPRASETGEICLSWRPDALHHLRELGYDGHVFVPECRDPKDWVKGFVYAEQIEWEEAALNQADCIVFWVPRDMIGTKYGCPMPALTTNDEFGVWKYSGKVIWGDPGWADHVSYQRYYAKKLDIPSASYLRDTLSRAVTALGAGALRNGGECQVPLHIWKKPEFQDWLKLQKEAGNRLDHARVLWSFSPKPGASPFIYALHVHVHIGKEDRVKSNEIVIFRRDMAMCVMYRGKEVVLVREFRSPVRNEAGFVYDLPGGSSWKADEGMETVVAHEIEEETGLKIIPLHLIPVGFRQFAATLSAHKAQLFALPLTEAEIQKLKDDAGNVHGVVEDTERTYVEVWNVKDIIARQLVDWSTLGMILAVVEAEY
jgi:8-oxo-dGTP pyrophosphatase MutT (NUDIX family)